MPRTRNLETYANRQYLALIQAMLSRRANGDDSGQLVPCSRTQASSLRGEMYAWRRACESTHEQAATYGIDSFALREFALQVTNEGLLCVHQSTLVGPALIEAALGKLPPASSPSADAFAKLQAALGTGGQDGR